MNQLTVVGIIFVTAIVLSFLHIPFEQRGGNSTENTENTETPMQASPINIESALMRRDKQLAANIKNKYTRYSDDYVSMSKGINTAFKSAGRVLGSGIIGDAAQYAQYKVFTNQNVIAADVLVAKDVLYIGNVALTSKDLLKLKQL